MSDDEKIEKSKREAEEERLAISQAIGIKRDFRPLTTIYNSASGIIVALVERYSSDVFDRCLFFRHISERAYRPIPAPAPDIHYDDPITSLTQPVIYYTVKRVTKQNGGFGGDWLSVDRFDLARHAAESIITKSGLQLPDPYARGWVSQLFSVAVDDSAIYCRCGLQLPKGGKVHYWVCSVEPQSQRITLLSRLEGVWF